MGDDEECQCEEGAAPWMATFSDMATLLLTFFVLLLSFANMDVQHFRVALGSVKEAFGVQFKVYGDVEAMSTAPVELSTHQSSNELEKPTGLNAEALQAVRKYLRKKGMDKSISVVGTPRGIALRMKELVLFDSGEDKLLESGEAPLDVIAELFEQFSGSLSIEGHTDDVPIANSRFRSNWELSTARSTAVLRYLSNEKSLDTERMHVAGYAHMKPVAPNDGPENRAKNRRVEFIFEYDVKIDESQKSVAIGAFRLPFAAGYGRRSLKNSGDN